MVARYPLAWDRFEVAYVAICPAPGSDYWEFAKYHLHDTLVGLWTNYRRKWHEVSCQVSEHGNKWYKTALRFLWGLPNKFQFVVDDARLRQIKFPETIQPDKKKKHRCSTCIERGRSDIAPTHQRNNIQGFCPFNSRARPLPPLPKPTRSRPAAQPSPYLVICTYVSATPGVARLQSRT
jgi:hypothetical protein